MAPTSAAWVEFDRAAVVSLLYASFERFVYGAVSTWLASLPGIYESYSDLPEATRVAHRRGVSEILAKLGGSRYTHLSEPGVLRGIFMGSSGQLPYELLTDAFLIDDRNLRSDSMKSLLGALAIEDPWSSLVADRSLVRWLQVERGAQATFESELNQFVTYRNEAAHGALRAELPIDELKKLCGFVETAGTAISNVLVGEAVRREVALGQAADIGEVIREFSHGVIGCRMSSCHVERGDTLMLLEGRSGSLVTIESIQVSGTDLEELDCQEADEVGFKVAVTVRPGSRVIMKVPEGRAATELAP